MNEQDRYRIRNEILETVKTLGLEANSTLDEDRNVEAWTVGSKDGRGSWRFTIGAHGFAGQWLTYRGFFGAEGAVEVAAAPNPPTPTYEPDEPDLVDFPSHEAMLEDMRRTTERSR